MRHPFQAIRYQKLDPNAIEPSKASDGAACFDLYALGDSRVFKHMTTKVGTGIAIELPSDMVALVYSRSGHAKQGIRLANSVGVIDSDYRGEIKVMLTTDGISEYVRSGSRIAQMMIIPVPTIMLKESDHISDTDRGDGGFGSTGG